VDYEKQTSREYSGVRTRARSNESPEYMETEEDEEEEEDDDNRGDSMVESTPIGKRLKPRLAARK